MFGFLIAPSAVVANGVIQGGVLSYLLSMRGVGSGMQSHLIGLLALRIWRTVTVLFMSVILVSPPPIRPGRLRAARL